MEYAELKAKVEAAVKDRLTSANLQDRGFTSIDISRPIAEEEAAVLGHRTIRHSDVRNILHEMFASGKMVFDHPVFATGDEIIRTPITVYKRSGSPVTTFLYHPDDPDYDVEAYSSRRQQLPEYRSSSVVTPTVSDPVSLIPPATRQLDLDDEDPVDPASAQVITSTSDGQPVARQCQVQHANDTINIPQALVRATGWGPGRVLSVTVEGGCLQIKSSDHGPQRVDAEGRIRVHGANVAALAKDPGDVCTAMVVCPQSEDRYIRVQ